MSPSDCESKVFVERAEIVEKIQENEGLRLDPHGFPLRPQPSTDELDPLNWPSWVKLFVLIQISFLGFLGPFSQGTINSALRPLAEAMGVTVTVASYSTTIAIVFAGVAPLIYAPLSNYYGRRPLYLITTTVGIAANAGCAVCQSWVPLLVARAFVGIGTSVGMGLGASVVSDLYFMHQRGFYMGIYVVFVTNGAHIAAIVGGFTAKYAGWRWCYWVPTIILAATWVVNLVCLPETLYRRGPSASPAQSKTPSRLSLLGLRTRSKGARPGLWEITHCFIMLKYPSVLLGCLYYSIAFGVGTVLFAVTGAAAFGGTYKFDTEGVGLAIGVPTTVGSVLGELVSGAVSDNVMYLANKRKGGNAKFESRLYATIPGAFLLPAGVIIQGVCLQYKTHWSGPCVGIAIAAFGLQIVSTTTFAYLTDCYKPQSAEISTVLNFGRLTFSFTLGFYMIPFAKETTFGIAWTVIALINLALYLGIVLLMWRGAEWRARMGTPNFDHDL